MMARPEQGFDAMAADNIAPLVVWLGSDDAADVTAVFEVTGGKVSVAEGWEPGPAVDKATLGAGRARLGHSRPARQVGSAAPVIGTEGHQVS